MRLSQPNINDLWPLILEKELVKNCTQITYNPLKNSPILTNLVGVNRRHIHTKYEANTYRGLGEAMGF